MSSSFKLKILAVLCYLSPFCVFSQDTAEFKTGLIFADPSALLGIPLAASPFSGEELPASVDLSPQMPPVGKQKFNDCVAWSVAYSVKSYQEHIETRNSYFNSEAINRKTVFSPSYIYSQINNGHDGGASFEDALNILSSQGAATQETCPYNEYDCFAQPTAANKAEARTYKISFWRQVNFRDPKEVKAQLNAGYPVMIGASLDSGFRENGRFAPSPYIWRNSMGGFIGKHAMVIVGYDDDLNAYKVMNSWGKDWGNGGYVWIDYNFAKSVINEAYVAKDAKNDSPPINTPNPNNPVVTPTPIPTEDLNVHFISNIPNLNAATQAGTGMGFSGTIRIPHGVGSVYQVVIMFYYDLGNGVKGPPVGSGCVATSTVNGFAATGTSQSLIPEHDQNISWQAIMPYSCLNAPRGFFNPWGVYIPYRNNLIAEPVLYIDNFAVAVGQQVPFWVNL